MKLLKCVIIAEPIKDLTSLSRALTALLSTEATHVFARRSNFHLLDVFTETGVLPQAF